MTYIVGIGTSIHPRRRARLLGIIGLHQNLDVLLNNPEAAEKDNYGVPRPRPVIVGGYMYAFNYDLSVFPSAVRDWFRGITPVTNSHVAVPKDGYKVVGALFRVTPGQLAEFEKNDKIGTVYKLERVKAHDFLDPIIVTDVYMGTALPEGLNDQKDADKTTLEFLRNAMHRLEQRSQIPGLRVEWDRNTFVRDSTTGAYRPVAELYPKFTPSDIDYSQIL